MTHDVFISYSSDDQKIVEGLSAYLEQNGIRCFVAYRDIPHGMNWAKAIPNAIKDSKMMVAIFSEEFNISEETDKEISLFAKINRPILTFRLSDTDFEGVKAYHLNQLNWIDAFPNPEKSFGKLSESIKRLINNIPPDKPEMEDIAIIEQEKPEGTQKPIIVPDNSSAGNYRQGKKHGFNRWRYKKQIFIGVGVVLLLSIFLGYNYCSLTDRSGYIPKYDEQGNVIEYAYFGKDGNPCLDEDGVAKWTNKYDDRGNCVEVAYFGINDTPCLYNGYAKRTNKYDDRGNCIEEAYFGTDGSPCLDKERVAKKTLKYDERGNRVETACYGIDDNPCLDKDGVAKWTNKYDDRGNCIEEVYFGTDGNPCLCKDGYAKSTSKYDERRNQIEVAYFDTGGNPCLDKEGVAKKMLKYDDRGNRIETACYGIDDNPCLDKDGVAKWTNKYDDRGNCIEEAYFDTSGSPCLSKDGYARMVTKYDTQNNPIRTLYYDVNDRIIK